MTPLERLLAEAIPDGTFGGARIPAPKPKRRRRPEPAAPPNVPSKRAPRPLCTPRVEADRHYAALALAIGESPLRPVPASAPPAPTQPAPQPARRAA